MLSAMDGRPENIADYFIVVGLGDRPAPFRHVDAVAEETITLRDLSDDPVTDIVLISRKHETCPKGYK